ncbi:MAG: type I restriction-modification enzyme R subunit C-terminal domain-containing protein, partial [Bacteroidota bacterium]
EISNKREEILRVLDDGFWEDITFHDVDFMVKDLAPLMKYFEPERKKLVIIDDHDRVISRSEYIKEIKEDEELKKLLDRNEIVRKIRNGKCITSNELLELERELSALRPELSIENIQKYHKKDFLLFLREIIGLSREKDPKELIEERFDKYIISGHHYNSRQMDFLLLLKKVFAERKHIEIEDFTVSPLADENPLYIFEPDELRVLVDKCNQIKMC